MKRIALYLVIALAFAAAGFAAAKLLDAQPHTGRPVSEEELDEMKAAAAQAARGEREIHLVRIKVARTAEGTWASASDPTPAADLRIFFVRRSGRWLELAASSGCLREAELAMPRAVEKALGACTVAG